MGQPLVLLVHYDPRQVRTLRSALEAEGFSVHSCTDGESALTSFPEVKPDVVVVEAMIPKRNGFEVCRDLKATPEGKKVPVVITSGVFRSVRHRAEALHTYGCQEFLGRGFSPADLVKAVRSLLPGAVVGRRRSASTQKATPAPVTPAPSRRPAAAALMRGSGAVVSQVPDEIPELAESEISNWLDSLFPENDSGPLARHIEQRASEESAPRESPEGSGFDDEQSRLEVDRSLLEAEPVSLDAQAVEEEAGAPLAERGQPEPGERTLLEAAGAGDQLAEGEPFEPLAAGAESLGSEQPLLADDDFSPATLPSAIEGRLAAAGEWSESPVPNLDPRAIPDLAPVWKTEETITLADEPVSAPLAVPLAAPSAPLHAPLPRAARSHHAIFAIVLVGLAGGVGIALWLATSSWSPTPAVYDRPARRSPDRQSAPSPLSPAEPPEAAAAMSPPATLSPVPSVSEPSPPITSSAPTMAPAASSLSRPTPSAPTTAPLGHSLSRPTPDATSHAHAMQQPVQAPATKTKPTLTLIEAGSSQALPAHPAAPGASVSTRATASGPTHPSRHPAAGQSTGSSRPGSAAAASSRTATISPLSPSADAAPSGHPSPTTSVAAPTGAASPPEAKRPAQGEPIAPSSRALPAEPSGSRVPQPEGHLDPGAPRVQGPPSAPPASTSGSASELSPTLPPPPHEVNVDAVDLRPVPLTHPAPPYPAAARQMKIQGEVLLQVLVTENGRVGEVRVVRAPSRLLGDAAQRAVRGWRYSPAFKDGAPVRAWITQTIEFKIQ